MASLSKKIGMAALLTLLPVSAGAKSPQADREDKGKWEFSIGPSFGMGLESPAKDFLDSEYAKIVNGERTSGATVSGASGLEAKGPLYMGVKAGVSRKLNDSFSLGVDVEYSQSKQKAESNGGTTGTMPVDATYNLSQKNLYFGLNGKLHLLDSKLNPYLGMGMNMANVSGDYAINWTNPGIAKRTYQASFSASKAIPTVKLGIDGKLYRALHLDVSASLPLSNSVNASWTENATQNTTWTQDASATFKVPARADVSLKLSF